MVIANGNFYDTKGRGQKILVQQTEGFGKFSADG